MGKESGSLGDFFPFLGKNPLDPAHARVFSPDVTNRYQLSVVHDAVGSREASGEIYASRAVLIIQRPVAVDQIPTARADRASGMATAFQSGAQTTAAASPQAAVR